MPNEMEPILIEKLSKAFLMNLTDGVFLVSNLYGIDKKPEFAEIVKPLSSRNDQWQRIKEARADQRLCHVFRTEKDYEEWFQRVQ